VFWAFSIVLIRKLALREKTSIQVVLNNVFFLAVATVPVLGNWHTPSLAELAMLVSVGLLGGIAQYAMFEGMKHADASIVAGFEYAALIWAFLFGYLIWSDIPRPEVFVGAAMIFVAGLLMVMGERARLRR
jgi:drug/metabolite transporter (DMT)-like permease